MIETKIDTPRTWGGRDSQNGEQILSAHIPKLRAEVRRDSYAAQSHANVAAWTDDGWKVLASYPIGDTDVSKVKMTEADDTWKPAMLKDLSDLIEIGRGFFQ